MLLAPLAKSAVFQHRSCRQRNGYLGWLVVGGRAVRVSGLGRLDLAFSLAALVAVGCDCGLENRSELKQNAARVRLAVPRFRPAARARRRPGRVEALVANEHRPAVAARAAGHRPGQIAEQDRAALSHEVAPLDERLGADLDFAAFHGDESYSEAISAFQSGFNEGRPNPGMPSRRIWASKRLASSGVSDAMQRKVRFARMNSRVRSSSDSSPRATLSTCACDRVGSTIRSHT